jgi:hypothetical protein
MKYALKIGERTFKFKKDALAFYKSILNSYNFGKSLNDEDFDSVIELIDFGWEESGDEILDERQQIDLQVDASPIGESSDSQNKARSEDVDIVDIKVSRVQFNTKCFEIFYSDSTSQYISYILLINKPKHNPERTFSVACRSAIQSDLIQVKQSYFKIHAINGFVKCQETGQLSNWDDLAVDHRQPNTFSVIVDRFKEVFRIDVNSIDYDVNELNIMLFRDEKLIDDFKNYHQEKANLRIVRKECNQSRSGMARIKRTSKDLTIKSKS